MENYFQEEAFNLDKVLDEFEQNEGKDLPWEIYLGLWYGHWELEYEVLLKN